MIGGTECTCRVYPVYESVAGSPLVKESYCFRSARQHLARGAAGHQHRPEHQRVAGIDQLRTIVGAVMTIGLLLACSR